MNLGIYLKAVCDGYEICMNKEIKDGYVKFGTYSRVFCEVLCNYILKERSKEPQYSTLHSKMEQMKQEIKQFPYKEMNYIRLRTNGIVHGVNYGKDAHTRFISRQEQKQIFENIKIISEWLRDIFF